MDKECPICMHFLPLTFLSVDSGHWVGHKDDLKSRVVMVLISAAMLASFRPEANDFSETIRLLTLAESVKANFLSFVLNEWGEGGFQIMNLNYLTH